MDDQASQVVEQVMAVLPVAGLALAMGLGLVLWLVGGRLARPACVISGLVLGGLGGLAGAEVLAEQGAMMIPLVIGGAIAGALLAALLFRIWMGVSGAALLAVAVPAAVLVWQGTPPVEAEPGSAQTSQAEDVEVDADSLRLDEQGAEALNMASDLTPEERAELVEAAREVARGWYDRQLAQVRGWWGELSTETRGRLYIAAAIGAAIGLALGLIMPNRAAAMQSALVGSILLLLPGRALVEMFAPGQIDWLLQSPRKALIATGLITLLGCLIQWTFLRRRADSKR